MFSCSGLDVGCVCECTVKVGGFTFKISSGCAEYIVRLFEKGLCSLLKGGFEIGDDGVRCCDGLSRGCLGKEILCLCK